MQDTSKYLIHAQITANGVVERSDVVGAIFGQTEGLLGEELDLRSLQESAKVGRIDVEIDSEGGQSFGEVTIASGMDRVETAILAAALETIERVGPCRATVEVTELEDVRQAKRRKIVERAKDLLAAFDESVLSSEELIEEVRRSARVEHVTEYEGYPAGPRVADSDAVVVVEGRADVVRLLEFGIKIAIAVEGTDIPEPIAALTAERTVTAFLDGDRGGDLILKELTQVGDVDYVAFAPEGKSVEDLSREAVLDALREKVPFAELTDAESPHRQVAATDGSATAAPDSGTESQAADTPQTPEETASAAQSTTDAGSADEGTAVPEAEPVDDESVEDDPAADESPEADEGTTPGAESGPGATLSDHAEEIITGDSGRVRLLDEELLAIAEADATDAFEVVESAEPVPRIVVLDGTLEQRLLDLAAQRGVDRIVARELGQFVKKPAAVRTHAVDEIETVG